MNIKSENKKNSFGKILKNTFFLILILQFAPQLITTFKQTFEEVVDPKVQVGFLRIEGLIARPAKLIKQIHAFAKNKAVKALLININSPGGFPGSSQALYNELKFFAKNKPIVTMVDDLCASGAYYPAIASNTIIANPSSIIGSIGVFLGFQGMPLPDLTELMASWKIHFKIIQAGKYKTAGNFFKSNTNQELQHLQELADDTYQEYISNVAQARNIPLEDHTQWADGKIFTGKKALDLKLIDRLGSIKDAFDELKKLLNTDKEIRLITPTKKTSFLSMIRGEDGYAHTESFASLCAGFIYDFYKALYVRMSLQSVQTL